MSQDTTSPPAVKPNVSDAAHGFRTITALTKHLQRAESDWQPRGVIPGKAFFPLDVHHVDKHSYVECFDQRLFLTESELRLQRLCWKVPEGDQINVEVGFHTAEESDAIRITYVIQEDSGYPVFPLSDDALAFFTELVRQELAVTE